jgi:hypothetical protein
VPPRRIWLELRKLAACDAEAPGTWGRALALCYHLGLLPHLFPWLKGAAGPAAAQQAVLATARLAALREGGGEAEEGEEGEEEEAHGASSSGAASSSSGGGGGGGSSGGGGGLPLELRVAALVHPGSPRAAYNEVRGRARAAVPRRRRRARLFS